MAVIKCKMCGGNLVLVEDQSVAECEYCGSKQTVPVADNEKKLTLFARANRLRAACEFDKAAGIYESIVADFPEEAEAYWGLVLCKYGIEYVDDLATGKKIPTCHRSSFASIMEDSDFEQVLENADGIARRVYRDEAKAIEEIRKGIIAVSANEQPYDIFICYKETDENGERTLDSVLAQDVYDTLKEKHYRVFFSRITLEDKLGVEYEPYIFAALNSAKIMLVFGTDYEYFNAVWVKNEWSRYLKLMAKDKTKHLIPCFKGIDAYDMPKEFARLQAQDFGKVGAIQDLLRGIDKILPRSAMVTAQAVPATPVTVVSGVDLDALLKRGWMALEDGKWDEAAKAFDQVLDRNPESIRARLGIYLADKKIRDMAEAEQKYKQLFYNTRDNNDVKRIRKLANGELTSWFQKMDAQQERLEQERLEQERLEGEQRIAKLEPICKYQKKVQCFISAGDDQTVGLKVDGTVVAVGDNVGDWCKVCGWSDIVAISTGGHHTVGLKADGTVVDEHGLRSWTDIVAISAGNTRTVGLKADGTVVVEGTSYYGECRVSGWTDIVAISAGDYHTVGLKADGTVVATEFTGNQRFYCDQCEVSDWTDIVAISAGSRHTVGLKANGTVVTVGHHGNGRCDVSDWADIVAISAGRDHTVGLKADGTMVAVGRNESGQCNISGWTDIVAISAGNSHTVGLKADGTVVATKYKGSPQFNYGQCNVSAWKLFQNINSLEEERAAALRKRKEEQAAVLKKKEEERAAALKKQEEERAAALRKQEEERVLEEARLNQEKAMAQRRNEGLCQHCGGTLKGLFSKKCVSCGKPKDY